VYPTVIVSDRDLALMNAIEVKAKCKMLVHPREAWDVVMKAWATIVDCSDCEAFSKCVENFESASLA